MKAVIPAGGMGTRMLPATKSMPKEMLPVVDKPVIQYVVEEAVASGCDEILIVTGRGKRAIEDHFDHSFELEHHLKAKGKLDLLKQMEDICELADIHYVRQKEPLGLGHAVLCGRTFVGDDPFAVLLGDDILLSEPPAVRQLRSEVVEDGAAISVARVPDVDVSKYGIIEVQDDGRGGHDAINVVEKPQPHEVKSRWAALGRYILPGDSMQIIAQQGPGYGGEIQLADTLATLAHQGRLKAVPFTGTRLDAGSVMGFLRTNIQAALLRGDTREEMLDVLRGFLETEVAR